MFDPYSHAHPPQMVRPGDHAVGSRTWVVFEARVPGRNVLAWCEATIDGPGFVNISYTERDGISPVDAPEIHAALGQHLFTVTVQP